MYTIKDLLNNLNQTAPPSASSDSNKPKVEDITNKVIEKTKIDKANNVKKELKTASIHKKANPLAIAAITTLGGGLIGTLGHLIGSRSAAENAAKVQGSKIFFVPVVRPPAMSIRGNPKEIQKLLAEIEKLKAMQSAAITNINSNAIASATSTNVSPPPNNSILKEKAQEGTEQKDKENDNEFILL